ncbi:MAG: glycosyltransferase family 4 protein [Candidatus Nanoarchaeia archaeon]|nr:glycosyltransferase family 4 protein [Candidatus Nanoarchaeia archaeon]
MKKLLIVSDSFYPRWDGISKFLINLIPKLKEKYEISLIVPNYAHLKSKKQGNIDSVLEGVKIYYQNVSQKEYNGYNLSKPRIQTMIRAIRDADFLFIQTIGPLGALSIILSKILRKKSFYYMHSIEWLLFSYSVDNNKKLVYKATKFLSFFLHNLTSKVIVPSSEVKYLLKNNGIHRTQVIHVGIILENYEKGYKKNLFYGDDKFTIGYVGRIAREKDLKTLYLGFKRFSKEYPSRLVIVGDGDQSIKKYFEDKENVMLLGQRDDADKIYSTFDVFALASLTETTSLVTLEAMASRVPVVVTPVGYMKYYINDEENGLFFKVKDPYTLYATLKKIYKNKALKDKLIINAYKTVKELFNFDLLVQDFIQLFESETNGKKNR